MKRVILILIAIFALSATPVKAELQWKEGSREYTTPMVQETIEVYGKDGSIIVHTPRKIRVRVLTILGQTVSDAMLNPGTSELKINSRGIYIVKIGDFTKKVAL